MNAKTLKPWNAWISDVSSSNLNHQLPKKNQYGDYPYEIAIIRATTKLHNRIKEGFSDRNL